LFINSKKGIRGSISAPSPPLEETEVAKCGLVKEIALVRTGYDPAKLYFVNKG
jgi:hypothetical protein